LQTGESDDQEESCFSLVWNNQAKGPSEDLIQDNQVKSSDDEIGELVFGLG